MNIKKYIYDRGVGTYLALAFSTLSVLLTLILVEVIDVAATGQVKSNIGHGLAELALQTSDKLDRGMFERFREVRLMSERADLVSDATSRAAKRHMLESLESTYPYYAWIGMADRDGRVVVSAQGLLEGADVSQRPWFQNAFKGIYVGDVHEAKLLAKLLPNPANEPKRFVDVAFPYTDASGKVIGVLGAHLSWTWASDIERSIILPTAVRRKVESIIVSDDGKVLLGPAGMQGTVISPESKAAARTHTGFITEKWPDGKTYLVGFSKSEGYKSYPGLGWTVLVRQNIDDAFAPVRRIQRNVFWSGMALAVLFSLFGLIAARRITRPLSALAQSARLMQSRETQALPPSAGDYFEVDALTNSFNALITDLVQKKDALKELNLHLETRVEERTVELAHALDAVRSNEKRIRTIIDTAQDAYIATDLDGRVTDWNAQAEKMFGWRREEAIGRSLAALVFPARYVDRYHASLNDFRNGAAADFLNRRLERFVVNRQGEEFPVEVTVGLVKIGQTHFFSAFLHDISGRKKIERMKNEFISTVSHELRTPLTSIRASLSMLADGMAGELPPDAKALLDIAHGSCERLVRLVSDVLDIEKIESGNMEFAMTEQPLAPLAEQAIDAIASHAAQCRVTLALQGDRALRARVDRDRMIQVITNLLSNAIKFSAPGSAVDVHVEARDGRARLSVTDRGSGIPHAFRERMFQKFAQADATDSRQRGGTGLGLSICKSIVEQHGGTISFDSEEGRGTVFYVDLPGVMPDESGAAEQPSAHLVQREPGE
jgi:PAS domain S-box-containing protein